jgi:hypothetical protein
MYIPHALPVSAAWRAADGGQRVYRERTAALVSRYECGVLEVGLIPTSILVANSQNPWLCVRKGDAKSRCLRPHRQFATSVNIRVTRGKVGLSDWGGKYDKSGLW